MKEDRVLFLFQILISKCALLINLLTTWRIVLLEKLMILQPVKKFPVNRNVEPLSFRAEKEYSPSLSSLFL